MRVSPKDMPANTDGQAHLFFDAAQSVQFLAISTTGCFALQTPDNPVRIFHWYYRRKNAELIALPPIPWLILWSCRAPWNTEPCGFITRLEFHSCGLVNLDIHELKRLTHLHIADNLLEHLDCSGQSTLKSLNCAGNNLASLQVEGCRRLIDLRIAGNRRLRETPFELLTLARGQAIARKSPALTSTSLFDL